ncbi:MAG: ABC transporter ATP-binding protein, partial [Paracoccus sp. (in: a-proteobacteria)]|nr:ABC transporter ATP-binding protein [Paracoccus sp. (in: a-proteobacteria)]
LRSLALWDKRDAATRELSGGMKRRVLIAKALSHRPKVLFLDEPTAGVDVALRREMWQVVDQLRRDGVTIILTTHYLEEAEEMADRIGVINRGELLLMKPTAELMGEFGRKRLSIQLDDALPALPTGLEGRGLTLGEDGRSLRYEYDTRAERTGIARLLADLSALGLSVRDVETKQSSLEEVFMALLDEAPAEERAQ